jgi:FAD/FMN-containing dehydrogenase
MTTTLLRSLAGIVGEPHVLTGDATAGYAVDWTGRFRGHTPAVVRPRDTAEVAAVLALCTDAALPVVPQGGNTGLVGGGVPRHGEIVLSLTRLNRLGPVDHEAAQVTAGAGVTLRQVADADPGLDLPILIASRDSATVGGAVATNAGGLRVLRFGPMRAQLRGIEAVLADGTVVSHLAGLVKDNTGYDYPSLLAGSEGTLAVVTEARLRLVPRLRDTVTVLAGVGGLDELHALARRAVREVPGLVSAEFFTQAGLDILVAHAGLAPPLPTPAAAYLLLEASGPGAFGELADVIGDREAAVAESAADRARLWSYRERHSEAAGFLGVPVKLDVSVPAAQWVRLASSAAGVVADVDPGARVITFGHVADGNVHVNIVPAAVADGRHEDAVFRFVASLGGSISAEHGIGALKAPWLPLARTDAERALFARIRSALDPAGTLNPNVLPRLSGIRVDGGPVGGHIDHGPRVLSGSVEDLAGAATQDRVAVVGVLPVAVGVVDDQFQGPVRAGCGPLEHGQVAVGVPGGHDRALPDVPVNRAGLLRAIVDDSDFGGLDEFGAAVADAELGFPDAADHPVRRQAVAIGRPGPHEVGAAAGEDPAGEAMTVQQAEQFHHRLVHRRRVGAPEARVPGRGQPVPADGAEFLGGDARVGERYQLEQGLHPARAEGLALSTSVDPGR